MATISSPGIGSGMDITGIVTKLSDLERQPLVLGRKPKSIAPTMLPSQPLQPATPCP